MAKYICPQCSKAFIYCKGCALTPDLYKEQGFCSRECYRASKTEVSEAVVVIEEEAPIEETFIEVETEAVAEEETPIEVETEVSIETPTEITTIKNETNTYKKKKNKYKYTSSL